MCSSEESFRDVLMEIAHRKPASGTHIANVDPTKYAEYTAVDSDGVHSRRKGMFSQNPAEIINSMATSLRALPIVDRMRAFGEMVQKQRSDKVDRITQLPLLIVG